MKELTMAGGLIVMAVIVILITTLSLIETTVLSNSRDTNDGGAVPIIPNTSSSSSYRSRESSDDRVLPIIPETSSITPATTSSSSTWKYDVFLSFRGEDTRKTFVDHLHSALQQHGIITYKDDVTLDRGDTIGSSLLKAIRQSQIALVIFSENYADSSWCLDELSYIMKCKKERGQIVMPIFYNVDPSDVRKQKCQFGEAFAKHNNNRKVESWKKALVDAGNIAGWEPKHIASGYEAKCVKEIVDSILDKLRSLDSTVEDEDLVGMGARLKQLKSQLVIESGGVRMVGIWGLGGGGKTTLANSLYLQISPNFDGCCFVGNIREESSKHGLAKLQEKILFAVFNKEIQVQSVEQGKSKIIDMLYRRKVLIVLDDVDHLDQLKALAGSHKWFGDGSRIIITTRDRHLLTTHRVDVVFLISLLSHEDAIRLFNKHAYNENNPLQGYEMLSQRIVSYAGGLPLALIVLGSFLYDKDNDEWVGTLSRLKDHPEMDILGKLRITYDGLKPVEKELFLDIACFHRGVDKDEAMEILDACDFYPAIGVKVLIQKALINISEIGKFEMHDLVQEMGHYIVRCEHPNNPEKHSRVWRKEDIKYIKDIYFRNATVENDKIEAIELPCSDPNFGVSSHFVMLVPNMKKLRILQVGGNYDERPDFLSNELRYIDWRGYPASRIPESFQPTKLVVLKMRSRLLKELWKGYKYLPCLKVLDLSWMKALVRTPDFGGLPSLEKLKLNFCESLEEIHPSLGNHSSLVFVEVRDCEKLTRFPSIVRMEKLETLKIEYFKTLAEIPRIETKMYHLVELSLERVVIEVLPSYVGECCPNLLSLKLWACINLKSIEGNFHALRKLNLYGCGFKDGQIPTEIGEFFSLQELYLIKNDFTRLDFNLSRLPRLKLLDMSSCKNLVELPELPSSLAILNANDCMSLEGVIRDEIHTKCKCLSQVSIVKGRKNIKGGERLLETMLLQGNAQCMRLVVKGLEIARRFEPRMVKGSRCRMQLPENWFNDFSGFLFCAAPDGYQDTITMKHVDKLQGGWEEETLYDDDGRRYTWVGYIPFSVLRHTHWWDPASTAIHIEMGSIKIGGCGLKLIPKRRAAESSSSGRIMETTHSSSETSLDHYKCKFDIQHDSKSAFKCIFDRSG